jgi:hypothetical protein
MQKTTVNIGRAEINGSPAHTVRVVESGELCIKALCHSIAEAKRIAKLEGERLGVEVSFENLQT